MLTDAQWEILEPLIEVCRPPARVSLRHLRRTISAILWRHTNGAKWRAVPDELGPSYAEIVHLPVTRSDPMVVRSRARSVLGRLVASRGTGNPIRDFAADLPALLFHSNNPERMHALCFNTVRQVGATFGLLGDHLVWLDENGSAASLLADQAKTLQFRLARAARKGQWDQSVVMLLQEMHDTWLDARTQIDAAWADASGRYAENGRRRDQAALCAGVLMTATPLRNVTP